MDPVELSVLTTADGARLTLVLAGELDMATASRLEASIEQALAHDPAELVLDMSDVRFMDSTGLRAVLRARQSCEGQGGEFFLIPSETGEQHQLFHVSGLIGKLTFHEPTPLDGEQTSQS